jgi:uncharacterized protein YfiM (DUF2279 family)
MLTILLLISVMFAKSQQIDSWTGHDKMAHYTVSITGTLFLTSLYEQLKVKRPYIKAAGTMFCIGLGKELIYDGLIKKSGCSGKDIVWNAAGCATGYLAVIVPFELLKQKKK